MEELHQVSTTSSFHTNTADEIRTCTPPTAASQTCLSSANLRWNTVDTLRRYPPANLPRKTARHPRQSVPTQCEAAYPENGSSGGIQKGLHTWWKTSVAYAVREIDDYEMHNFSESTTKKHTTWRICERKESRRSQSKALRTQRRGKQYEDIVTAAKRKTEAVDVVIRAVVRENWITITETAVPLEAKHGHGPGNCRGLQTTKHTCLTYGEVDKVTNDTYGRNGNG